MGGSAVSVGGDLGDPATARRVIADAVAALGGLDILVVNHGIWPPDDVPLHEIDDGRWSGAMRANLDGVFYVCRAAIPHLPDGARIVLLSSTAGQRGEAFHADYAATRGAVISLTKSLAVELAPRITVNCVAPGWVETEMNERPFGREAGSGKRQIEATIPLGRVASPEDVAGPIVFLCSDLARHITGEILNVNGGSVLCG
jgi:3-oxoacyl-[acyl-carrier protein] reductase